MTTTTSEPQRSGPGTPPVVGMVVRHCTGDHGWRTITEVEGSYPRMSRREDGKLLTMSWSGWDAGEYEISSPAPAKHPAPSPSRPDKREEAIDWTRFLPSAVLPASGKKTFQAGETWIAHCPVHTGGIVFQVVSVGDDAEIATLASADKTHGVYVPHDSMFAFHSRLIRHADGRWADGYGPNGPIDPACRDAAKAKARCTDIKCGTLVSGNVPYYCSMACLAAVEGDGAATPTRYALTGTKAKAKAPPCADRDDLPCGQPHDPSNPKQRDGFVNNDGQWCCSRACATLGGRVPLKSEQQSSQLAPWKCASGSCNTPLAEKHRDGDVCTVCMEVRVASACIRCGLENEVCYGMCRPCATAMRRDFMLPGTAHALAVAGARTWRRPTSYVPLDDPNGDDL